MSPKSLRFEFDLPHLKLSLAGLQPFEVGNPNPDQEKWIQALSAKVQSGEVGFFDLPNRHIEVEKVEKLAREVQKQSDGALIFGIGGSYLGAAAGLEAVRPSGEVFPIGWVSNSDPESVLRLASLLPGRKWTPVLISKSGNTVETWSSFLSLWKKYDFTDPVCVTDPTQGEMRRLATEKKWKTLEVPPNVGGRFSVLSAVGLFPFALGGLKTRDFLEGALSMKNALLGSQSPALLWAQCLFELDRKGFSTQVLMPYWASLELFSKWWVQLWGESLGKKLGQKRVGPMPVSALGTSDQHSLLQNFAEGPLNKVIGFLDVTHHPSSPKVQASGLNLGSLSYLDKRKIDEINSLASKCTEKSLGNQGVPTYRFELDGVTEKTLGALFFFFEYACALSGEMYGVNAFDQPGVEETKILLKKELQS